MKGWTTVAVRDELVEKLKAIHHHTDARSDKPTRVVERLIIEYLKKMGKKLDLDTIFEEYKKQSANTEL